MEKIYPSETIKKHGLTILLLHQTRILTESVINGIHKKGRFFQNLQGSLNRTNSAGKLVFHVFGALVKFERDIIRDRTKTGLTAVISRIMF